MNAVEMFDTTSNVARGVSATIKASKLDKFPLGEKALNISNGVAVGATFMKYHVSPDKHTTTEIFNDLLKGKAKIMHTTELE